MKLKHGTFNDGWRGNGAFISTIWPNGHILFAFRWRWRFALVKPSGAPTYRRLYVGPFEIEWSIVARKLAEEKGR